MNLFRSEGDAKNWSGYSRDAAAGLLSLDDIMAIFSAELFRRRADTDYVSNLKDHYMSLLDTARRVTNDDPFWQRKL